MKNRPVFQLELARIWFSEKRKNQLGKTEKHSQKHLVFGKWKTPTTSNTITHNLHEDWTVTMTTTDDYTATDDYGKYGKHCYSTDN